MKLRTRYVEIDIRPVGKLQLLCSPAAAELSDALQALDDRASVVIERFQRDGWSDHRQGLRRLIFELYRFERTLEAAPITTRQRKALARRKQLIHQRVLINVFGEAPKP